jgi:hypothetical protein
VVLPNDVAIRLLKAVHGGERDIDPLIGQQKMSYHDAGQADPHAHASVAPLPCSDPTRDTV